MPLINDRATPRRAGNQYGHPVAAGVKIYGGSLVCLDAAGNAVPGSVSTTLSALGRAEEYTDNSTGAAGDKTVITRKGEYRFKNDGSITRTDIMKNAYIVDDETVANNDGAGTRSIAGQIVDIDPNNNQVWVNFL